MKITSRAPAAVAVEPTDIQVQNVTVDSTHPTHYAAAIAGQRSYYMEVVLRIPLTDEDCADLVALRERMHDMQHAKLLEFK